MDGPSQVEANSYVVSKHGVIALTRSLGVIFLVSDSFKTFSLSPETYSNHSPHAEQDKLCQDWSDGAVRLSKFC